MGCAQVVRPGPVDLQVLHHPIGQPPPDPRKQPDGRGVERVVQIEHQPGRPPASQPGSLAAWQGGAQRQAGCRAGHKPVGSGDRAVTKGGTVQKDAYRLILEAIDTGIYRPGDRLVESELAERFGVSRTPVREALQRLETQSMLSRDGRRLIVASLDHNQLADLYVVRAELEGLAARLAAHHATPEEVHVLRAMVEADRALAGDPAALARANRRFHKQLHLASHNRFLVQQLDLVYRSMALLATTSLSASGRSRATLDEHDAIVAAIEKQDPDTAYAALRTHISRAFETRLKLDAGA